MTPCILFGIEFIGTFGITSSGGCSLAHRVIKLCVALQEAKASAEYNSGKYYYDKFIVIKFPNVPLMT